MAKRFRAATFNAENLAHPGVFFYKRDKDGPYDELAFTRKAGWMAGILDTGKPDIIGFQEIFSLEALARVIAKSSYLGSDGQTTIISPGCETDPATGRPKNLLKDDAGRDAVEGPHCALVSRFPVIDYHLIPDFPAEVVFNIPTGLHDDEGEVVHLPISRFERPVLRATIQLPTGVNAVVFVAHLKSKRPKFLSSEQNGGNPSPLDTALGNVRSLIVRAAEAVALRALILKEIDDTVDGNRGTPVILFGDLNDDVSAVTTEIIAGPRPPFYARDTVKKAQWDVGMTSVHEIVAQRSLRDVAYTHIFDGKYAILDHIHVSQEFTHGFPARVASLLNVVIHNDHVVDSSLSRPETPAKIVIDGKSYNAPALHSDHGVPVAEFEFASPPSLSA